MEQHPIPRQVTTFEFKLIGFMTLKQFLYLVIFFPLGLIVYFIFPIPIINILFGVLVGSMGLIFAFVPIYDRPVDVWVKNLYKRLTNPTQFIYKKNNQPANFLNDLYFTNNPHQVLSHVESEKKLKEYLEKNKKTANNQSKTKKQIDNLLKQKLVVNQKTPALITPVQKGPNQPNKLQKKPFFSGVVKNHKLIPLPGILIYIKDKNNKVLRLLKTNPHGVFATFNPLLEDEYFFEIKDPNNNYFFDTMKIKVLKNNSPIEIFSKETI